MERTREEDLQLAEIPFETLFAGNVFIVIKSTGTYEDTNEKIIFATADPIRFVDYYHKEMLDEFDDEDADEDSHLISIIMNGKDEVWNQGIGYDEVYPPLPPPPPIVTKIDPEETFMIGLYEQMGPNMRFISNYIKVNPKGFVDSDLREEFVNLIEEAKNSTETYKEGSLFTSYSGGQQEEIEYKMIAIERFDERIQEIARKLDLIRLKQQ